MRHSLLCLAAASLSLLAGCLSPVTPAPPIQPARTQSATPPTKQRAADAILPITYEDLDLPMQPDSVFADWMLTQRVRDLDGKQVRLTGFMCAGSVYSNSNVKQFMMLREKECPYGPGGQAHHAVAVFLRDTSTSFMTDPITVDGVLAVKPFTGENGNTWSVYTLQGTSVK